VSTSDVVKAIGPELLRERREVLVVTHPDQHLRCMSVVAKGRDRYYCKGEHRLPYGVRHHDFVTSRDDGWHDPESGQFCTARRHRCLIHEAIGRLNIYQNERFSQAADHLAVYRQTLNRKGEDELVRQPKRRKRTQRHPPPARRPGDGEIPGRSHRCEVIRRIQRPAAQDRLEASARRRNAIKSRQAITAYARTTCVRPGCWRSRTLFGLGAGFLWHR
jgi:hypothetical protein